MIKNKKAMRIFTVSTLALWLIYSVAVLFDADVVYNVASPLTALSAIVLISFTLANIGRYRNVAVCFMIGTFIWFSADILLFVCTYIVDSEFIFDLSDNMYLVPDYLFALGLVFYIFHEYSKTQFQRLLSNTFITTVFIFVLGQRVIHFKGADNTHIDMDLVSTMLYFFIVLFTLTIMFMIFWLTKFKEHTKGAYASAIALTVYNLFEIRYTYYLTIDKDPESIYIDIIYLLGIVIYAVSLTDPDVAKRGQTKSLAATESRPLMLWVVWVNALILFVSSVVLLFADVLKMSDVYILVVAILSYIIMEKTLQTNMLNEKLLEKQEAENLRLEQLVLEKTRELQEMNHHLEMISSTDALTGLYNRRYGFSLIENLASSLDRQPFALYSMDLNHFKPINDNYGHDKGDLVLKMIGKRLANLKSFQNYTAIRVGGDEFMMILERTSEEKEIERFAQAICESVDCPISDGVNSFQVSTSIGIAVYPNDTENVTTLLKLADSAMYAVKHTKEESCYLRHVKQE